MLILLPTFHNYMEGNSISSAYYRESKADFRLVANILYWELVCKKDTTFNFLGRWAVTGVGAGMADWPVLVEPVWMKMKWMVMVRKKRKRISERTLWITTMRGTVVGAQQFVPYLCVETTGGLTFLTATQGIVGDWALLVSCLVAALEM